MTEITPLAPPLAALFAVTLRSHGLHAALRVLNATTAFRLTGVYRFEADTVRSIVLFDRKNPHLQVGVNVPWQDSYCRLTAEQGSTCEISDAMNDPRLVEHAARVAVQAYAAVLLKSPDGGPLGTLCHYDLHPVIAAAGVFDDLRSVSQTVEAVLWALPTAYAPSFTVAARALV